MYMSVGVGMCVSLHMYCMETKKRTGKKSCSQTRYSEHDFREHGAVNK